jgi:hypothetical protein
MDGLEHPQTTKKTRAHLASPRVGAPTRVVLLDPDLLQSRCVPLTQLRRRRRETPNPSKPVPSNSRVAGSGTDAGLPVSNIAPLFAVPWKDGAAAALQRPRLTSS